MEIHPSMWTMLIANLLDKDIEQLKFYDHVIASLMVFAVCLILAVLVRKRLNLIPSHLQQVMEVTLKGLLFMLEENIGQGSRKYLPLIGALAFFIFLANFMGMVPSFSSATGNLNTTVACALIVFVYYNYEGFRENGAGYIKHFMGPMPALAPLMFPIEIISHLARPFSLSVRLFGNISGEHIVAATFYTQLVAWLVPVPIMFIGLFAAFLQTYVFIMLTQIYIAGSIAHEH